MSAPRSVVGSDSRARPPGVVLPMAFAGDDVALVEALRAHHPGAKAAFFHRYAPYVERVITRVIGFDRELADIIQEVFMRALGSLHTLESAGSLRPWLARVAAHTSRKILRSRSRRAWLRPFKDSAEEATWEPWAHSVDAETRAALSSVYRILDGLPSDERIAFALRYIESMELSEVAAACEVSLSTIKRRLQRAELRFLNAARRRPELEDWVMGGTRWDRQ